MALTPADITRIKGKISGTLQANAGLSPAQVTGILPVKDLQGKLYEAHVLALIIEKLRTIEGCTIILVNTGLYTLKQKGSPITRRFPYFRVSRMGTIFGEIFTDTEFSSLSFSKTTYPKTPRKGTSDYHELDIVMFKDGLSGRPFYTDVMLAVECKATKMEKSIFREVLGFRRELSMLSGLNPTPFQLWPIASVNANPSSVHLFYCWDKAVNKYIDNGLVFGILVQYETM